MDNRIDSFVKKFTSAQSEMKDGTVQDIVSIKFRDDCVNSSDYQRFINDVIIDQCNLDAREVKGEFQGRAWLISDRKENRLIVVEHETGLEILYIAGSIASLISLIPMISSGWKYMRHRFPFRGHGHDDRWQVEMRRLNAEGKLIEQQIESVESYLIAKGFEEYGLLKARVSKLEKKLAGLSKAKRVKK